MNKNIKPRAILSREQKASAVMSVLLEKQTIAAAAQKLGVDVSEVEQWRAQYLSTIAESFHYLHRLKTGYHTRSIELVHYCAEDRRTGDCANMAGTKKCVYVVILFRQ